MSIKKAKVALKKKQYFFKVDASGMFDVCITARTKKAALRKLVTGFSVQDLNFRNPEKDYLITDVSDDYDGGGCIFYEDVDDDDDDLTVIDVCKVMGFPPRDTWPEV